MNDEHLIELKFDLYHISEAANELAAALRYVAMMGHADHTDTDLSGRVVHAYHHLNWYWNGSRNKRFDFSSYTHEEMGAFWKVPDDIVEMDSPRFNRERRMRPVNGEQAQKVNFTVFHLSEAIYEITCAITGLGMSRTTDPLDRILKSHIIGAYQHMNIYWNGVHSGDLDFASKSKEEQLRMMHFAPDLNERLDRAA